MTCDDNLHFIQILNSVRANAATNIGNKDRQLCAHELTITDLISQREALVQVL